MNDGSRMTLQTNNGSIKTPTKKGVRISNSFEKEISDFGSMRDPNPSAIGLIN